MNHHLENYYSGDSAWNQFVSLYFEVAYFSGVGIFQDIIDNKFDHNESLTTEDTDVLLGAIEHYFEYDDFQD
ncbi:hypothetical protein [Capnocytophaga gingivalis]|uniref:Uncharacterized protein n=1 Tax=Capnocytophaga gingivalis TaxID=1017 RepID=A0ABU5ZE30_9FLAO|nr:hypothetical protein [Capnocytophaga gingivalis]MEB3076002.1 hypothetical protein [Capnocytophaga gingivalis]